MRFLFVIGLLAVASISGCLSDGEPQKDQVVEIPELLPAILQEDGTISVTVPVDVFMVGFSESTAATVRAQLDNEVIEHGVYSFARSFLAPEGQVGGTIKNFVQPTTQYRVHAVPLGNLVSTLDQHMLETYYDANAAEDALVEHLTDAGFELDANRPSLVLMHLGTQGHSYRILYETGYVNQVRAFGERTPLLVLDVSAAMDPWVGTWDRYNSPLDSDDTGPLVDAVVAATHFRLLQGPLYPPTLAPCHAVTLLTAVRGTAAAEVLPGYTSAEDMVQADNLTRAWETLLGEGRVHVDPVVIQLPTDDPGLEAILRTGNLDLLRFWMDENWGDYWVEHEGCEAYVSIFLVGDVSDNGISGIAMYDIRDDRRLSFSSFNDLNRMREEGTGMGAPVFYVPDDSRYHSDWLDFLYTHESGHLFSMRHPHDVTLISGGAFETTFSSIWSSMSYQQDGKLPQFGVIDHTNYMRNRAGFLLEAVIEQDGESEAVTSALDHMGKYHWEAANRILEDALAS